MIGGALEDALNIGEDLRPGHGVRGVLRRPHGGRRSEIRETSDAFGWQSHRKGI